MPAQQQTMTTAAAQGHLVLGWEERDANLSETAHDLANLLQILSSSLSLMKREIEQPDRVRMRLATAMIGVDQCVSLSRTLFVSPAVADDDAVMLQTLIGNARPLLELAVGPDIEIEVVAPAAPLWVYVERARLDRALLNLVINAAQAIDGPGCIRLACRTDGRQIFLTVEDDGPGFTPQTEAQGLERRFTTKPRGSGLGLASIDALMKAANGLVTLGRSDLGGASVRMAFPVRRPAELRAAPGA